MNRKIGYARNNSADALDVQIAKLKTAGCEVVFADVCSENTVERDGLKALLDELGQGDTIVMEGAERLGRNVLVLQQVVDGIKKRGAEIVSIDGKAIDFSACLLEAMG
ncbi:MAG: recombinase family protein [Hyphomicrobium sp.]